MTIAVQQCLLWTASQHSSCCQQRNTPGSLVFQLLTMTLPTLASRLFNADKTSITTRTPKPFSANKHCFLFFLFFFCWGGGTVCWYSPTTTTAGPVDIPVDNGHAMIHPFNVDIDVRAVGRAIPLTCLTNSHPVTLQRPAATNGFQFPSSDHLENGNFVMDFGIQLKRWLIEGWLTVYQTSIANLIPVGETENK